VSTSGETQEEEGVGFFGREGVEEDEGTLAADVACVGRGREGGRSGGREGGVSEEW
jgi:hypothetical protein